jgi:hypothetical protein
MKLTLRQHSTIGFALATALMLGSSPGIVAAAPSRSSQTSNKTVQAQADQAPQRQAELRKQYQAAFNRLLGQCNQWQPHPERPKPIDNTCRNLVQNLSTAGAKIIKQPSPKRIRTPVDAATLTRNQAIIDRETKQFELLHQMHGRNLDEVLGLCGEGFNPDPAMPQPNDAACNKLMQKFIVGSNVRGEQELLVQRLKAKLPAPARQDEAVYCEGFYLASGTFISLPACPRGQ